MQDQIKNLIRKKKVKWPSERGFDKEQWKEATQGSNLSKAGLVFDEIFSSVREELGALYKEAPKIGTKNLLEAYMSFSNRERVVLNRDNSANQKAKNMSAFSTDKNKYENELSYGEVSVGAVDAIQKAVGRLMNEEEVKSTDRGYEYLSFVSDELMLSQLYNIYENYWQALVWGEYEFTVVDDKEKIYKISQIDSEKEVSYLVSQNRKEKLAAQELSTIAGIGRVIEYYKNDSVIYFSKQGKKRILKIKPVGKEHNVFQAYNASMHYGFLVIGDKFPEDYLKKEYNNCGFCLSDVFNVFRSLVLMSQLSLDGFPEDDSVFNHKKLSQFSVKIKKYELSRALSKSLGYQFIKCNKIIDFLTFFGKKGEDLWCYPLVNLSESVLTFSLSSLLSPNFERVIEHWIVKMGVDLSLKGVVYENIVLNHLNDSLKNNAIFKDYEEACSKRIKLDSGEEEIDLMIRIGDKILLGEIKSIVTSDSPISQYRAGEVLEGASLQALRKVGFFRDNISDVFGVLGWEYKEDIEYDFIPVIVNSSKIYSGFSFGGIPVCDELILRSYFSSNIFPLASKSSENHIAWFTLYKNEKEAADNMAKYFNAPPQIIITNNDFRRIENEIPCVKKGGATFLFDRLIHSEMDLKEVVKRKYPFEVELADDFEEVVEAMDVFI